MLVTLPSLIMLIHAKSVSPSTFWYTLFIGTFLLIQQLIGFIFLHACTLGPGLYSPNVFSDASLINYGNLYANLSKSHKMLLFLNFLTGFV